MENNIPFNVFEQDVINKILEKNSEINRILQKQYKHAHTQRDFTNVGFFSNFQVPEEIPSISTENFQYAHLLCDLNGINDFGGFILYIRNGRIACLEGYSFDGPWPKNIIKYRLHNAEEKIHQ